MSVLVLLKQVSMICVCSFLNNNSLVIMSVGEINYDDLMNNSNITAYYKAGYILLVIFAVAMVVLATNLLIGTNNIELLFYVYFFM